MKYLNAEQFKRAFMPPKGWGNMSHAERMTLFADLYYKAQTKAENLPISDVRLSLPTEEQIDKELEEMDYVNYSNGFVNPETQSELDMVKAGAKWLLQKLKSNEA